MTKQRQELSGDEAYREANLYCATCGQLNSSKRIEQKTGFGDWHHNCRRDKTGRLITTTDRPERKPTKGPKPKSKAICVHPECRRRVHAWELCHLHYQREERRLKRAAERRKRRIPRPKGHKPGTFDLSTLGAVGWRR